MSVGELTNARTITPAPAGTSTPRKSMAGGRFSNRGVWRSIGWTVGTIVVVAAAWELTKAVFGVSDTTMPHTWSVLAAFGDTLPNGDNRAVSLLQAIGVTLQEAAAGLAVGIAIGVAVGVVSAKSRFASFTLTPILVATQTFPLVAIVPALSTLR